MPQLRWDKAALKRRLRRDLLCDSLVDKRHVLAAFGLIVAVVCALLQTFGVFLRVSSEMIVHDVSYRFVFIDGVAAYSPNPLAHVLRFDWVCDVVEPVTRVSCAMSAKPVHIFLFCVPIDIFGTRRCPI